MPVEISVHPPVLTINNGATFMVTDMSGHIAADSEQGVFSRDTRFVSYYEISANGNPWVLLTSSTLTYYGARIYLTNGRFATMEGEIAAGSLSLVISRSVSDGIHEDLDISNFGVTAVHFNLEVALRSDFADLFEVKAHKFVRRGRIETNWDKQRQELRTSYSNRDFQRHFIYKMASDSPPDYANGRITFEIDLPPGGSWHSCCEYCLTEHEETWSPTRTCLLQSHDTKFDSLQREWLNQTTALSSANEDVYRLYRQSVEDMGALRLHDHDAGSDVWLPAAAFRGS